MAAKVFLLLALCILPALVSGTRPSRNPFLIKGRVFCDTCRAGFETSACTSIPGARVRIECKLRDSLQLVYSVEGVTDSAGSYQLMVNEDHEDQLCYAMLVSSPQRNCATPSPGRDKASVMLTRSNGIASDTRYANAMGFMMDQPMSWCAQLLQQYQTDD